MIKLITTDSYYNLFNVLIKCLDGKVNSLDGKNLIFCEEKISLMAERCLLSKYGGSFNTDVYSFGNYLRLKNPINTALTKEGSAMAVKRVLSSISLNCFKASRLNLAPSLYELIIQLKSAKVKPSDLQLATQTVSGTLKNKLTDICAVYSGYEQFIQDGGFDDQSSMLDYLPQVIENDCTMKDTDVYIVGFNGWTSQIRSAIISLLNTAKSVTAILVNGDNELVYVNETANVFRALVEKSGKTMSESFCKSEWTCEGKIIVDNLFNPCALKESKRDTQKIFSFASENRASEAERVAQIIRQKVMSGECRYKDITVALPDANEYLDEIERAFELLEIPYFIDVKKRVNAHPLIKLILSYIDATRKNLERRELSAFYKNPLFCENKALSDQFENYVIAYNINYARIKEPFTFKPLGEESLDELNEFRARVVKCFTQFDVRKLLGELKVKQKIESFSEQLIALNEIEESAVNNQIYNAVDRILSEIELMLGGVELSIMEFRNVFLSGVSAMELYIIPQYNDAVFIGGFKQTALARAKHLFALGLTSSVPAVREDVALLSDGDIDLLEQIKVLVEPKIKVINHRERENVGLALSAFTDSLYLSYPLVNSAGDKTVKSEVLSSIESMFNVMPFPKRQGYLTFKEGLSAFSRACGDFAIGRLNDFTEPTSFYTVAQKESVDKILSSANQEVKLRLDAGKEVMAKTYISPTRIEDYYKCPYRAFLSSGLKLKRREEGVVDGFSVGNLMHEIFKEYALKISSVSDKQSSDQLVFEIAEKTLDKEEFARYLTDAVTKSYVQSAIKECAKFCYKNYLAIKNSEFKVEKTEAEFGGGENPDYPAIDLMGGQVKLVGKIDRVDASGEYYRVLDYKTVSPSADLDLLFTGKKLQLYLYAKAVNFDPLHPRKLAGVYYMPVSDKFRKEGEGEPALSKGVTLSDRTAVQLQDKTASSGQSLFFDLSGQGEEFSVDGEMSEQGLNACVDYAVQMSEMAVRRMREGFIAPTPCDDRICGYCEFRELCPVSEPRVRKHGAVDADIIMESAKGEE